MNTNTYPFHKMRSGFPRCSRIEVERYREGESKTEGETKREKRGELWEEGCSHNAKSRDVLPRRRPMLQSEMEAFKDDSCYSLKSTEVRLCQHGAGLRTSSRIEMQMLCVKTATQRNMHIERSTSTVVNVNRVSHTC